MARLPEDLRLAAIAAAEHLRRRAESVRPDEDLQESIARNAAAGDEFAGAYAKLRELGLEDKALNEFGVESATPTEMREAADILEQLTRAERIPGKRKRGERTIRRSIVWKFRIAAVIMTVFLAVPLFLVGAAFFAGGWQAVQEALHDATPPAVRSAQRARQTTDAPPLAPVNQGFERTASNRLVPARPRDHVTDRAGVLSADSARVLNDKLVQFERETTNQVLVFIEKTLPAGTSMEQLTNDSIRHWGVGQKGKDNGVIFFVFVDDRKMRIEVGYGLEGVLTDARSKRITSQIVKPWFQQGKLEEGIEAGAVAIMDVTRGGDAALQALESRAGGEPTRIWWLTIALYFLAALGCLALAIYVVRSVVRFFQGRPSRLFAFSESSNYSSSSGGGSGSSSSSGSYDSGGGSGGGGGASDSW